MIKVLTKNGAAATAAALLLIAASPASAQTVFGGSSMCGVPAAEVTWIGGSPDTSDIGISDGPLFTTAEVEGNAPRYFAFSLGQDQTVRLEAQSPVGDDTVLALFDAAGSVLGSDDDGGGNLSSRLEIYLAAGDYCIAVGGFNEGPLMAQVQVGREEHAALTPGISDGGYAACTPDTEAAALASGPIDGMLSGGQSISATVVPAGQRFQRFDLSSPSSLTIRAENEDADPVLRLFDPSGALIAENDDFRTLNSQIMMIDPLAAGSYCIEVSALNDESLPIELTVEPFDEEAYLLAAYAAGEISPPVGGDYPMVDLGALTTSLSKDLVLGGQSADWASFTVAESSLVVIRAIGLQGTDPVLSLFGPTGEMIEVNDDVAPGDPSSRVVGELGSGTYTLAVKLYEGGQTGAVRLLVERYIRAQ